MRSLVQGLYKFVAPILVIGLLAVSGVGAQPLPAHHHEKPVQMQMHVDPHVAPAVEEVATPVSEPEPEPEPETVESTDVEPPAAEEVTAPASEPEPEPESETVESVDVEIPAVEEVAAPASEPEPEPEPETVESTDVEIPAVEEVAAPVSEPEPEPELLKQLKVVINVPSRTLWLVEETTDSVQETTSEVIVHWYPVALGQTRFPTPVGNYQIIRMVKNPTWENPYKGAGQQRVKPGAYNPLGTRWIGFHKTSKGEYGMHGTPSVRSIGSFSSHGCVRMKIKDAEDLYDKVEMGMPVDVIYDLALIRPSDNTINLVVYPDHYRKGYPTADAVISKIKARFPHAVVNTEKVRKALQIPLQKPVPVGVIKPES